MTKHCYVLAFHEIDRTQIASVGGKGAHLGELSRIEGIRVPAGFCVTTAAFQRFRAEAVSMRSSLSARPSSFSASLAPSRALAAGVNPPV
jgi:phosphoenolpyruvate synthase/pyruvate phosphate dikinase